MEWKHLEPYGISWNLMEPHGMSWNVMECLGILWNLAYKLCSNVVEPSRSMFTNTYGALPNFCLEIFHYVFSWKVMEDSTCLMKFLIRRCTGQLRRLYKLAFPPDLR